MSGETQKRVSQARIVAATNRDLRKAVRNGHFRADLSIVPKNTKYVKKASGWIATLV